MKKLCCFWRSVSNSPLQSTALLKSDVQCLCFFNPAGAEVWSAQTYVVISILLTFWNQTLPLWPGSLFFFWACRSLCTMCYSESCEGSRVCMHAQTCMSEREWMCFQLGLCVYGTFLLGSMCGCMFMCFSSDLVHLICQDKRAAHMGQSPTAAVSPSVVISPSISSSHVGAFSICR